MKKIIGEIILAMVVVFLIIITCIAHGWKEGLITWAIALILAVIIIIAIHLITDTEGE